MESIFIYASPKRGSSPDWYCLVSYNCNWTVEFPDLSLITSILTVHMDEYDNIVRDWYKLGRLPKHIMKAISSSFAFSSSSVMNGAVSFDLLLGMAFTMFHQDCHGRLHLEDDGFITLLKGDV